jgi:hypothetical protein
VSRLVWGCRVHTGIVIVKYLVGQYRGHGAGWQASSGARPELLSCGSCRRHTDAPLLPPRVDLPTLCESDS